MGQAGGQLERGLALCREWNVPVFSSVTAGFLGYVSVLSGRVEEGLSLQQEGLKAQESGGLLGLFHSLLVVRLGEALRRAGNRAQAEEHLATATTMYREMDMRSWSAKAEAETKERA